MPIAIAFRFLSGRFHATPWGRHVNEGVPEWPPSSWRILRTLIATWKRKLPDIDQSAVTEIIKSLSAIPEFVLPPATTSHTRHFMPWFKNWPKVKVDDKTQVFDTFIAINRDQELVAIWPEADLTATQTNILGKICFHVGFLGRAESWCEARLLDRGETEKRQGQVNCVPLNGRQSEHDTEIVRVLCADEDAALGNEHTAKTAKGKNRKAVYDPDWHLCMETLEIHKQKWSDPPGAKWVKYSRDSDCFKVEPRRRAMRRQYQFQVARFVLDGPVLPLVEETLPMAELMRSSLMSKYSKAQKNDTPSFSPIFSGKNVADGTPLQGHRHAYFLPTDEDNDGRIDHITVVSEMVYGHGELKALDHIRRLNWSDAYPLNLMLTSLCSKDELCGHLSGPSRIWQSATPFVVTRHPKKRGQKKDPPDILENPYAFAGQVLIEELDRFRQECRPDIPAPSTLDFLQENRMGAHRLRAIQFKRSRRKRGDDGARRPSGGFRITFPEPVRGPICLGHSSHFGLGLFVPAKED